MNTTHRRPITTAKRKRRNDLADVEGSLLNGCGTVQEIYEPKFEESQGSLLTDTLRILNRGGELQPLVSETLRLIRVASGFDAVGLRLRHGEDCPYFEHSGFSQEFLREENFLCEKKANGEIVRDTEGRAVLQCTCGLVLSGRIPSMSCFTESGSFWTNAASELLALPPEEDPRIHPRNRCIHTGYESVGLFPVRSGREIVGLLQLNGRRPGRFTPELIAIYENLSQNIGLAFQRAMAEESLRRSEMRFRLMSDIAGRLLASENPQILVNELCEKVLEHLGCHAFFNYLVDEGEDKLRLNAYAGISAEEARKIDSTHFVTTARGSVSRILPAPDVKAEPLTSSGIQALACHPLMVQGKVIGTLSFGTRSRSSFSSEDIELMKTVTDQVATAMERMRLIEELRQSRNELDQRVQERTAELERMNRELQDFVFIASHDLSEPLRKILTFGSLLETKCTDRLDEPARDFLSRMTSAADRMKDLLQALLRYSRVEMKKGEFRTLRLNDVVKDAASDMEIAVRNAGARLEIGPLPTVTGDKSQLRQLFQNLIGNAAKYHRSEVKSFIKIYGEEKGGIARIFVEDNGIGFDEKYLDKIFLPFQRLHGRNEYPGTGMGLAICKKVVERHGGEITAKSIPGRGATFIITLPAKHTRSAGA